ITLDAEKYSSEYPKTIFSLTLRDKTSGRVYRFIQSHIPGGPINSTAACEKFAEVALKQYDPTLTVVLMGDMNQNPNVIEEALKNAANKLGLPSQPYQHVPISYPTHINTKQQASWIDNFFIYTPEGQMESSDKPDELFSALIPVVNLLKKTKNK